MGKVKLDAYLFFKGNAKEALEFYQGVFGGELEILTYGNSPGDMPEKETMKDKVMHGLLSGGDIRLMASDTSAASDKAAKIELSLSGDDGSRLSGYFKALGEGGEVRFPLQKAPWGDSFGQLTDRYSIPWMVNIRANKT